MHIPFIIERNENYERTYDIYSKLLTNRIIFLEGEINDTTSNAIVSELLYLDSISNEDIYMYINSPGGSITSGFAIYDTMNYIKCPVSTICIGMCASMAAFLLACGEKGRRIALPHSKIMIHQPLIGGNYRDQATNLEIEAAEMLRTREMLNDILASVTGKSREQIDADTDRNNYMDALTAKEYGLVDNVIGKRE